MSKIGESIERRNFLKMTAAGLGGLAASGLGRRAFSSTLTHAHRNSLKELDPNSYNKNFTEHSSFNQKVMKTVGQTRSYVGRGGGKMNMMAIGERRFIFLGGDVWDVSNPLEPKRIGEQTYKGGVQNQVAYNRKAKKWILMTWSLPPFTQRTNDRPFGKYGYPYGQELIERSRGWKGLRGVYIYDCSDPYDIKLLSKWSCDQGDPERPLQQGNGTHRNYYDGGRYAYLDTAPDDTFIHMENPDVYYTNCVQIIDVEDPANPKFVANWWVPGQRVGEEEDYSKWREYHDRKSFTALHGAPYVPLRVEDGGKYCYCSYGSFGFIILDISTPSEPKMVSRWQPPYLPGAIPMHTVYMPWWEKGLALITAESLNADCYDEPMHPNFVMDISDVSNPRKLAEFGDWTPPPGAPYKDFCDARGRKGTHNPPHLKAPGKAHPTFSLFAAFNAGLQAMDFSDPTNPTNAGYFIPRNEGDINNPPTYYRLGESVFVEWDRNLIWAGFNSKSYCLSHPALGEPIFDPMPVKEWSLPGLNEGA